MSSTSAFWLPSVLTFIGSMILFVLGIAVATLRQINKNLRDMMDKLTEHHTEIRTLRERVGRVEDHVFKN